MKKIVYPIFVACDQHSSAVTNAAGFLEMAIDLKNAFHYGYIASYGITLQPGANPLLGLYEHLIAPCREFRFNPPGIGADTDSRKSHSAELGRCMALGVLTQHYGYTWFASISNLRKNQDDGWTAENIFPGDTPDFLVCSRTSFAVAEAKGTHDYINVSSSETEDWRTQVRNIVIKKDGRPVSFKSWIIATRFILTSRPRVKPQMLIEDPPTEGRQSNRDDRPSLALWIARAHILRNLERLGLYNLIIRIREPKSGKATVLVWQCLHPRLMHLRFVGIPVDFNQHRGYPPIENMLHRRLEWINFFENRMGMFSRGFFDGQEQEAVRAIASGNVPNILEFNASDFEYYDFLSLLPDGSLIAPMNLMRLVDIAEI